MARGVLFALTSAQEAALMATRNDHEVRAFVDVESAWDEPWLCETDKAWDAMHRCLGDGTLGCARRASALDMAVLGGGHHYEGAEYVVAHVRAHEVARVSAALETVTEAWMRDRYDRIDPSDYQGELDDEDFAYTWYWFQETRNFYRRAAAADRAVISLLTNETTGPLVARDLPVPAAMVRTQVRSAESSCPSASG